MIGVADDGREDPRRMEVPMSSSTNLTAGTDLLPRWPTRATRRRSASDRVPSPTRRPPGWQVTQAGMVEAKPRVAIWATSALETSRRLKWGAGGRRPRADQPEVRGEGAGGHILTDSAPASY